MADGQVVFEITGDNRPVRQSLQDTTTAIERESRNWDQAAGNSAHSIESSFAGIFNRSAASAVAAKVGKALLDWGQDAIQAASDLEEVQNVVDVTFGDGAAKIESWAKAAGQQFGLTETQAKKFTSTLGAMMKSAGLAGPEIVSMSTDLAGLAADMASFYNLDFDTAFQKIRSGISGETEPLKQLGINMSVANLEAYALTQGITKAFDKMSQSEQTVLRYQYLMQATADAQGDFARTSDGYANSLRQLETNMESLKANVGKALLPIINEAVAGINDMIGALTQEPPRTVLDDFADIDLQTDKKLAEISATADEAHALIGTLDDVAKKANELQPKTYRNWRSFLTALTIGGKVDLSKVSTGILGLSDALNGRDPNTDRAQAWRELLGALSADIEGLSKLTDMSPESTKRWLEELSTAANQLDPTSAEGWGRLAQALAVGLNGDDLKADAVSELLALGKESDEARLKLSALGYSTDDIDTLQKDWLETCQRLVDTIPGLSEIINAQTGEVRGGTDAIRDYVDEWERGQKYLAFVRAQEARRQALDAKFAELPLLEVDWYVAENKVRDQKAKMDALRKKYGLDVDGYGMIVKTNATGGQGVLNEGEREYNNAARELGGLQKASADARAELDRQTDAYEAGKRAIEEGNKALEERYGATQAVTEATEAATAATAEWSKEQEDAAKKAVKATTDALEAVEKYYSGIQSHIRQNLDSAGGLFKSVETPAEQARNKMEDLTGQIKKLNKEGKDVSGLNIQKQAMSEAIPTIQNMTAGLKDQLEYLNQYKKDMAAARAKGVSEEILASLADGSTQSADYLRALANASEGDIKKLNSEWDKVEQAKTELTDNLTETKLSADEQFKGLVDAAQSAAEGLDVYNQAEGAMERTVQGIADGIAAKIPSVQGEVDALNKVLGTLGGAGGSVGAIFKGFSIDGTAAKGLDYVPFDNYLAQLHEGESVLTAEEARVWRDFKRGGAAVANTIDYDAMGGLMRENIRPGGNVYLDGRIVGRVISEQQGDSLRALERSGWQR
jgi:hypothetical protein